MSKAEFYRQCRLQKVTGDGTREQVSYIPEPYCQVGDFLELKDQSGAWDNGWKVISASEQRPAAMVLSHERDHLNTRKASDI